MNPYITDDGLIDLTDDSVFVPDHDCHAEYGESGCSHPAHGDYDGD